METEISAALWAHVAQEGLYIYKSTVHTNILVVTKILNKI